MKIKKLIAALCASVMLALTACTEDTGALTTHDDSAAATNTQKAATTTTATTTTTTTTTTVSSSEQTTAQPQTTTQAQTTTQVLKTLKPKVTTKEQTTTTVTEPKVPSGVKSAKDLLDLAQSVYKKDMDTAANTIAQCFGAKLGKCTDEDYYGGVQGKIYDQNASKMNIIGVAMNEMTIESFKNGDASCGLLAFHLGRNEDRGQITGTQAKAAYDTLYNQFKAACGEPATTIEDAEKDGEKSDYSKYYWVQWDTPAGAVWLCWGTDMWGQNGYNNCIISVCHPDRA